MGLDVEKTDTAVDLPESDRAFHVEQHGIDVIPVSQRYGRPRGLFWIWMSSTVGYLNFAVGGGMVVMGLSLWASLGVILAGNLWWFLIGWLAVSGPASGTPSEVITRTMFGVRGNRIFGAGPNVAIGIFYEIVNIAFGVLAADALFTYAGVELATWARYLLLLAIAILCFLLPLYGHATILKLAPWISVALAVGFVVLAVFVFQHADFSYTPAPVSGSTKVVLILTGYGIAASFALGWGSSADYARYLPAESTKRQVVWWTALGGFIPTVLLGALGVVAATAIDMSNAASSIDKIVPSWFTPIFLALVLVTQLSGNALTAYSTGLAMQAFGIRISRLMATAVAGVLSTAAAWWLVFVAPDFLSTLNSALRLSASLLGPMVSIYAVDILLRRNCYDGYAINDERRGSPFWYHGGFCWSGSVALVAGTTLAALMANTSFYVGPVAAALGGGDLSTLAGPVFTGALYAVLWFTTPPYRDRRLRPGRGAIPQPELVSSNRNVIGDQRSE